MLILQMLTVFLSVKTRIIVRIWSKSESEKQPDSKLIEVVRKHTSLEWNAFISKTNCLFLSHSLRLNLEALQMM